MKINVICTVNAPLKNSEDVALTLLDAFNAHHTIVMRLRHYMACLFVLRANSLLLGCYADMTSTLNRQYSTEIIL